MMKLSCETFPTACKQPRQTNKAITFANEMQEKGIIAFASCLPLLVVVVSAESIALFSLHTGLDFFEL